MRGGYMPDTQKSNRNGLIIGLIAAVLISAAAVAYIRFGKNGNSGIPPKTDPMNYVSDVSLALCDLTMSYGESAADHSQLYECGDSYIISVYSDPSSEENHYRVYFDWSKSNLWAPQVMHYIDFNILSGKKSDNGQWVYRVRADEYQFEDYLFNPGNSTVITGPEFTMETDSYGRPVKMFDFYSPGSEAQNCLAIYMDISRDVELTYAGSHIASINTLEGNGKTGSCLRKFEYAKKGSQLNVTESVQNLPADQIAAVSYDPDGKKENVTRPYNFTITAYSFDEQGRTKSVSFADREYLLENPDDKAICTIEYSYRYGFPFIISKTYINNTTGKMVESETYNEDGYLTYHGKWKKDGSALETEINNDYFYNNNGLTVKSYLNTFENGIVTSASEDDISYDLSGRPLYSFYKFSPNDGSRPVVKEDEYTQYDDVNRIAKSSVSGDTLGYFSFHEDPNYLRAVRLYELGNYNDAINVLNTLISNSGTDIKYLLLRGKAWYALFCANNDSSYLSNADTDFDSVLRNGDAEMRTVISDYYLELADNLLRSGMSDQAKTFLSKSNDIVPSKKAQHRINAINSDGVWEDESGQAYDVYGNLIKRTHYDENGNLKWFQTFSYNERNCCERMTSYNAGGVVTGEYTDFTYDDKGKEIKGFVYSVDTGKPVKYSISSYRDDESIIESVYYYIGTDKYAGRAVYNYDEVNKRTTGYSIFDENDRRTIYSVYDFNSAGEMIGLSLYNNDGSYIGYESEDS